MGTGVVSLLEQGQLVKIRSRQWIVSEVRPSTLPPTGTQAVSSGPQHLLTLASFGEELPANIGNDLLAAKMALPHGQFHPWPHAEFGWPEQTARNFRAGAEQFGKSAIFADLPIQPSAAYLLAAPPVPNGPRQAAVEKADVGQEITVATAKKIMAEAKKKR